MSSGADNPANDPRELMIEAMVRVEIDALWTCIKFDHLTIQSQRRRREVAGVFVDAIQAALDVVGTPARAKSCGHPNHGNADHNCAPFLSGTPAPTELDRCGHTWVTDGELHECLFRHDDGWHLCDCGERSRRGSGVGRG